MQRLKQSFGEKESRTKHAVSFSENKLKLMTRWPSVSLCSDPPSLPSDTNSQSGAVLSRFQSPRHYSVSDRYIEILGLKSGFTMIFFLRIHRVNYVPYPHICRNPKDRSLPKVPGSFVLSFYCMQTLSTKFLSDQRAHFKENVNTHIFNAKKK